MQLKPAVADYYCNFGVVLAALGRHEEAVAAQRKALSIKADYPDALNNLGAALIQTGKLDEAIESFGAVRRLEILLIAQGANLAVDGGGVERQLARQPTDAERTLFLDGLQDEQS